ncbi:MAG: zf-HC2 domain-containing protein [Dermatophilaceae bacterium]
MSFVMGARSLASSRHVDEMLSAYADRSLPAATLLSCDQHVAFCLRCQVAVDAERRMLSSLRTAVTPELSSRLESALLGVAAHAVPTVPTRRPSPLTVVDRAAPAMHRSPVRAALLASLVAGASAAAAWSVGVSGVGPSGASFPVARYPSAAAAADSSSGSGSQAAPLRGTGSGVAGLTGATGLTTTFMSASITALPVRPWPVVRNEPALGTIEP